MFIERQLNISSLAIIQNIIEEIVNLASEYIEDFATEEADVETLQQAGDLLYQVEGAFKMVDLQAAILLCQETRDILKMIEESPRLTLGIGVINANAQASLVVFIIEDY